MKYYAFNTPVGYMARCKCTNDCVGNLTLNQLMSMKEGFWGKRDLAAPSTSERREKIREILSSAYSPVTDSFEFYSTNKDYSNRVVCEAGFLILLGLSNNSQASRAPSQWRRLKTFVKQYHGGNLEKKYSYNEIALKKNCKGDEKEIKRLKYESCIAYITFLVGSSGEVVPDATGISFNI